MADITAEDIARVIEREIANLGYPVGMGNPPSPASIEKIVGKLLALLPPGLQATEGWQPIESAPNSGERVLCWHPNWSAPSTAQLYGSQGWMVHYNVGPFKHQPTHFMPLPASPIPGERG